MPASTSSHTLLCVLDWGLGHAARSLALVEQLEATGHSVDLASCGRARIFLQTERPDLICHELPAYDVTYPTRSMPLNVALQLPRWLRTIWRERGCTRELVKAGRYDRVISDNRFGCYVAGVPSVFLTHQLHPITHNWLVSRIYRWYLRRFDAFWVPDHPEPGQRLSGKLSDATGYQNVKYIGWLSRLQPTTPPAKAFAVLALLSGPEPMRTQLENILLPQLAKLPGHHVLVRGLPGGAAPAPKLIPPNVSMHDFAGADQLSRLMPAANRIVCRSGYSTLMDVLAVTQASKLVLVPTPGQTEQIYLAERMARLMGSRWVARQDDLGLQHLQ